jgi:hypothetical protein
MSYATFRWIWICIITFAVVGAMNSTSRHLRAQGNDAKLPLATVHVQVCGPFGEKIETAQIHLLSPDRQRDLARPGQKSVIADVPYGTYIVSAWGTGGGVAEREVTVNTKVVWVRIGLPFPGGDRLWPGGDLVITGDIRPAPAGEDWWARVEGVFLHGIRESPISQAGKFSVGGLEMGTYLVEVFEGSKLRHIETVEIDTKRPNTHLVILISQERRSRQSRSR